jgi:hypothetical protein
LSLLRRVNSKGHFNGNYVHDFSYIIKAFLSTIVVIF